MKPESILKADVLDILFENRNKEYGAYELRSHYNGRLKKSLMVVLTILIFLFILNYWKDHFFRNRINSVFKPDVNDTLQFVEIPKEPVQPKPIQSKPVERKNIAMVKSIIPRIVPNNTSTDPPPTTDELDRTKIGTITKDRANTDEEQLAPQSKGGQGSTPAPEPEAEAEVIVRIAEVMPEFPGGADALRRFLLRNLRMPRELEPGSEVRVLVNFVVDKDGSISRIELTQSGGSDFDNEVKRVMAKMPHWKPGRQNGRNIAVYYKLPVVFQSSGDN